MEGLLDMKCPVCMAEAKVLYKGYWDEIVGCSECVSKVYAEDIEKGEKNEKQK